MNPHLYFQELMAAAIDFELSEDERGQLNAHLAGCPECRRWGALFRADAGAIAGEPAPVLPVIRSRAILRAALRPARTGPPIRLLAVAAMLTTLGGALLIGGIGLVDDDPTESPRIALPSLSAEPSGMPSVEPGSTPRPPIRPTRPPATEPPPVVVASPRPPAAGVLPVRDSANDRAMFIHMEPDGNGNLYVAIGGDGSTVLALLDAAGETRTGWPKRIEHADDCLPKAAADGSVRVLCIYSEEPPDCVDVCGESRAYAFDAAGEALDNWPIAFPSGMTTGVNRHTARVIGTTLLVAAYHTDEGPSRELDRGWLVSIEANGAILPGVAVAVPTCCEIGPDGIAYGIAEGFTDEEPTISTITAFDLNGVRPGWPVQIEGATSSVATGVDGSIHAIVSHSADVLNLVSIDAAGNVMPRDPVALPFSLAGLDVWGETAPLVGSDNSTWILGDGQIVRLDTAGAIVDGWPYKPANGHAVVEAQCPPGDTGCYFLAPPPVLGAGDVLYVLEEPANGRGGGVTAVDPDGGVHDGWPVRLRRAGSEFWSVVAGPEGRVYVLAVEPEAGGASSATILAIDEASTVLYAATVIEPAP